MKRTRALVGAAIAVAVLLGVIGCASSPSTTSTPAPITVASIKSDSQWSHLLAKIPATGQVDVATSLSAFAASIGPVPGAVKAPGKSTPIESGSLAIDWVLANWSKLTSAQQMAVSNDLGRAHTTAADAGPTVTLASKQRGIPAAAHTLSPNADCPESDSAGAAPFRSQVLDIEKELSSRTGISFTDPIYLQVNTRNVDTGGIKSLMYTYGCAGTSIDIGGPSTVTGCNVHIQPRVLSATGKYVYSSSDIHSALIHELTHCLMIEDFGDAIDTMPAWYVEGVPTWAQNVLGGGDVVSTDYWLDYLETPGLPLDKRSYDAIGFFTHLAETGTDPWEYIQTIGDTLAGTGDSSIEGFDAADPSTTFRDNWGSGFSEGRYPGSAWKTDGPNLPEYQASIKSPSQVKDGSSVTVTSAALATNLTALDIDAQVIEVSPLDGAAGRITTGHGDDETLAVAADENFCTDSSGCKCPDGASNSAAPFTPMEDGAEYVGETGGPAKASVLITGETLKDFCSTPVACMIGTWKSLNETSGSTSDIEGGANIIWTITDRGLVTLNYNASTPLVNTSLPSALGTLTTTGTQVGQITLPNASAKSGPWNDRTVSDNLLVDGAPLAHSGYGDSGSWTCNGDSMTVDLSGDGGDAITNLVRESH